MKFRQTLKSSSLDGGRCLARYSWPDPQICRASRPIPASSPFPPLPSVPLNDPTCTIDTRFIGTHQGCLLCQGVDGLLQRCKEFCWRASFCKVSWLLSRTTNSWRQYLSCLAPLDFLSASSTSGSASSSICLAQTPCTRSLIHTHEPNFDLICWVVQGFQRSVLT